MPNKQSDKQAVTPRHVAIIMDRNGEWAKSQMLPRIMGHREGAKAVKRAVYAAIENNIEVLSLFAFSTENWSRPAAEVSFLMRLIEEFIASEGAELASAGVRLVTSGRLDRIPPSATAAITAIAAKTALNRKLILNIALDYSGQAEIVQVVKCIVGSGLRPQDITADTIQRYLYQPLPPVDLLIRTGGEQRISNFMLWQSAYAELYFTDIFWPDFTESDFAAALNDFAGRERRFGKTDEQL